MTTDTLKIILVAVHLVAGLAAVTVLLATNHLDPTAGVGLLGGLLGVGVGGSLSLVDPTPTVTAPPAPNPPAGVVTSVTPAATVTPAA